VITGNRLRGLLPSRRDYAELRDGWGGDVLAGVTVAVVALPLALAFGVASGVGATAGLVTAIIAGAAAAVFGGSNLHASRFLAELTSVSDVRVVVLRLGNLAMLDATGARALAEIIEQFDDRGIAVVLKVSSPAHRKLLHTVGALDRLDRTGHVAGDLPAALAHARTHALRGAREQHDRFAPDTIAAEEAPLH